MSSLFNQTLRTVCLSALVLASQSTLSEEASQTLSEKRLGLIKGTAPGIVVFDFGNTPRAAASAPAGSAAELKPSAGAAPQATQGTGWLNKLPPPSGKSLQSARRLDAPDQGIALPTAGAASQPAREPVAK